MYATSHFELLSRQMLGTRQSGEQSNGPRKKPYDWVPDRRVHCAGTLCHIIAIPCMLE
jgi:hypothetical protein